MQNSAIPAVAVIIAFGLVALVSTSLVGRAKLIRFSCLALPWVIFLALATFVRGWSWFVPIALNPDEAQVLAESVKIVRGGVVPWVDFDLGTVGPLEPIVAAPLVALFPTQPYLAIRVSIVLGIAVMALSATVIGWQRVRWGIAQAFAAIVLAVFLLPAPYDLFSYSTEVLPVTLLLAGSCLVIHGFVGIQRVSKRAVCISVLVGFFFLGLLPFAKLQVAPLVLCVMAAYWLVAGSVHVRRRLVLALPLVIPSGVVALVCLLSDRVRDAFVESTRFALLYSNGEVLQKSPYDLVARAFSSGSLGFLLPLEIAQIVVLVIIAIRNRNAGARIDGGIAVLMLIGPLGWLAIVYTGMGFPHHLLVSLYPTAFGVAIGFVFIQRRVPFRCKKYLYAFAGLVLCVVLFARPFAMQAAFVAPVTTTAMRPESLRLTQTPALRQFLDSCPDEIALWGWDPGVLVTSGKSHVGPWSALPSPNSVLSSKWLSLVGREKPICILDATGPGQFAWQLPGDMLAVQAGAKSFLADYKEIFAEPNYRGYRSTRRPSGARGFDVF